MNDDDTEVIHEKINNGNQLEQIKPNKSTFKITKNLTPTTSKIHHERKTEKKKDKGIAVMWAINDVQKKGASQKLIDALMNIQDLTANEKSRDNDLLETIKKDLNELLLNESIQVRERTVKVIALCGRDFSLYSMKLLMTSLYDDTNKKILPPRSVYEAVLKSLRKSCHVKEMGQLLEYLSKVASDQQIPGQAEHISSSPSSKVHVSAFNCYLAALCDNVISPSDKVKISKGRRRSNDKRFVPSSEYYLSLAVKYILDPSTTCHKFSLSKHEFPDIYSFNTVLNGCAKAQHEKSIKSVYLFLLKSQQERNMDKENNKNSTTSSLRPDIFTYNAILRATVQMEFDFDNALDETMMKNSTFDTNNNTQNNYDSDLNLTSIGLINDIMSNPLLVPNQYTIDLALIPLAREGRYGDIFQLLGEFVEREQSNRYRISHAFCAFLITLAKHNEIGLARNIMNNFLLESTLLFNMTNNSDKLTKKQIYEFSDENRSVEIPLLTKHFNIMIQAYRREMTTANLKARLLTDSMNDLEDQRDTHQSTNNNPSILSSFDKELQSYNSSIEEFRNKAKFAKEEAKYLYECLLKTSNINPDTYTFTSMIGIQESSEDITALWEKFVKNYSIFYYDDKYRDHLHQAKKMALPVYHSLITAYGSVNDPSMACCVFQSISLLSSYSQSNGSGRTLNTWNTLNTVFSNPDNCNLVLQDLEARRLITDKLVLSTLPSSSPSSSPQLSFIDITKEFNGLTCMEASRKLLVDILICNKLSSDDIPKEILPQPNFQTFCLTTTSLSHAQSPNTTEAMEIFREAIRPNHRTQYQQTENNNKKNEAMGVDGRLANAVLRCFGSDIKGAISAWKNEIGQSVLVQQERTTGNSDKNNNKHLIAAYYGLISVCGRAGRPDIALRFVYAMSKQGIDVTETALQCYQSGKRLRRKDLAAANNNVSNNMNTKNAANGIISTLSNAVMKQYESILVVECSKYDEKDKRKLSEKRVRIIF